MASAGNPASTSAGRWIVAEREEYDVPLLCSADRGGVLHSVDHAPVRQRAGNDELPSGARHDHPAAVAEVPPDDLVNAHSCHPREDVEPDAAVPEPVGDVTV